MSTSMAYNKVTKLYFKL